MWDCGMWIAICDDEAVMFSSNCLIVAELRSCAPR